MMSILAILLAGSLCGPEARELLWDAMKQNQAATRDVARTVVNWTTLTTPSSKQGFLDVLDDVRQVGGDMNPGVFARALGRRTVSPRAVAEYLEAVNYFRRNDQVIPGILRQAEEGSGASRNLVRIAGADNDADALAEMLEPIAAKRLGIRPDEIDAFGKKIDVSAYGVGQGTIEADCLLKDGSFLDAKWTSDAEVGLGVIKPEQLDVLEALLKSADPPPPISQALFTTNRPASRAVTDAIDLANRRIRTARGLPADGPQRFIDVLVVGELR